MFDWCTYLEGTFLGWGQAGNLEIERLGDAKRGFTQGSDSVAIQAPVKGINLSRVFIGKGARLPHALDTIRKTFTTTSCKKVEKRERM
jgi:hypothetical protein